MASLAELKVKAESETRRFIMLANKEFGINIPVDLPIFFDIRPTAAVAGYAYGRSKIRYNARILELNPEEFISRTIVHEVAHIACAFMYSHRIGHGPEWRNVMRRLGAKDITRCHNMKVEENNRRPWHYVIPACGCEFHLTTRRHNLIQSGNKSWCRAHKQTIKPEFLQGKKVAVKAATEVKEVRTGTKKEQAALLMKKYPTYTRGQMIELFMRELDMGKAGASTYYQMVK